jgi:hypothetical protein
VAGRGAWTATRAGARIGVLMPTAAGDAQMHVRLAGFLQGLHEAGDERVGCSGPAASFACRSNVRSAS